MEPNKVLTIGGWDPCGAFGMPADMKTFAALNCHGMGVMTVVTAQNSQGWYGAEFMSADFVAQQLDAVLSDYGAESIKTGFLGRVDLIEVIAAKGFEDHQGVRVIVDVEDLAIQSRARNAPALAGDRMDADDSGFIDLNDVRVCASQCQQPRCAVVAPPGPPTRLPRQEG